jgi:hypothetical protein
LVHEKVESRRRDYGTDENWRSSLEIGGGFGWGMKFSSFGASKKRRLSPSKQGGVSRGESQKLVLDEKPSGTVAYSPFFLNIARNSP